VLGLVAYEALALGKPVIVAKKVALIEVAINMQTACALKAPRS